MVLLSSSSTITLQLITPVTTEGLRTLDDVQHLSSSSSSLQILHSILRSGPPSIECALDAAMAVPDLVRCAAQAEADGSADAIIVDCMGDPGLRAVREAVRSIPVLGPCETSMHKAAMLGQRFSVVTVLQSAKYMIASNAVLYGVSDKLASVRVVDIPVLEIGHRLEELKELLAEQALHAVEEDGADVVILGCTGFLGCADVIKNELREKGHNVPVIDPIPVTICEAEAWVKAGLCHSKKTYEQPRGKVFKGYPFLTSLSQA